MMGSSLARGADTDPRRVLRGPAERERCVKHCRQQMVSAPMRSNQFKGPAIRLVAVRANLSCTLTAEQRFFGVAVER